MHINHLINARNLCFSISMIKIHDIRRVLYTAVHAGLLLKRDDKADQILSSFDIFLSVQLLVSFVIALVTRSSFDDISVGHFPILQDTDRVIKFRFHRS